MLSEMTGDVAIYLLLSLLITLVTLVGILSLTFILIEYLGLKLYKIERSKNEV